MVVVMPPDNYSFSLSMPPGGTSTGYSGVNRTHQCSRHACREYFPPPFPDVLDEKVPLLLLLILIHFFIVGALGLLRC